MGSPCHPEKALQVASNDLDGPVGGIPHFGVIAPSAGDGFCSGKRPLKERRRSGFGRSGFNRLSRSFIGILPQKIQAARKRAFQSLFHAA